MLRRRETREAARLELGVKKNKIAFYESLRLIKNGARHDEIRFADLNRATCLILQYYLIQVSDVL